MKVRVLIQVGEETLADVDTEADERGRVAGTPLAAYIGRIVADAVRHVAR